MAGEDGRIDFGTNLPAVVRQIQTGLGQINRDLNTFGTKSKSPLSGTAKQLDADLARLKSTANKQLAELKAELRGNLSTSSAQGKSSVVTQPGAGTFSTRAKAINEDLSKSVTKTVDTYTKTFADQAPALAARGRRQGQQVISSFADSLDRTRADLIKRADGAGLKSTRALGTSNFTTSIDKAVRGLERIEARAAQLAAKADQVSAQAVRSAPVRQPRPQNDTAAASERRTAQARDRAETQRILAEATPRKQARGERPPATPLPALPFAGSRDPAKTFADSIAKAAPAFTPKIEGPLAGLLAQAGDGGRGRRPPATPPPAAAEPPEGRGSRSNGRITSGLSVGASEVAPALQEQARAVRRNIDAQNDLTRTVEQVAALLKSGSARRLDRDGNQVALNLARRPEESRADFRSRQLSESVLVREQQQNGPDRFVPLRRGPAEGVPPEVRDPRFTPEVRARAEDDTRRGAAQSQAVGNILNDQITRGLTDRLGNSQVYRLLDNTILERTRSGARVVADEGRLAEITRGFTKQTERAAGTREGQQRAEAKFIDRDRTTKGQAALGGRLFDEREAGTATQVGNSGTFRLGDGQIVARTAAGARELKSSNELKDAQDKLAAQFRAEEQRPKGFFAGVATGATSRGFNGGNGSDRFDFRDSLTNIGVTTGSLIKYSAAASAIGLVTRAISDTKTETFDYIDSLTELGVRFGDTERSYASFTNRLQEFSRIAGSNVGEQLDIASRGIAAFANSSSTDAEKEDIGAFTAESAAQLGVISGVEAKVAAERQIAIGSSFNIDPSNNSQIADAVANAKSLGGGGDAISEALARSGGVLRNNGLDLQEIADLASVASAQTNDTGANVAQQLVRIANQIQSANGRSKLESVGIDPDQDLNLIFGQLNEARKTLPAETIEPVISSLAGINNIKVFNTALETSEERLQNYDEALGKSGEGQRQFEDLQNDITKVFQRITGGIKNLQNNLQRIGLFDGIGAIFVLASPVIDTAADVLGGLATAMEKVGSVVPGFKSAVGVFLTAAIALKALRALQKTGFVNLLPSLRPSQLGFGKGADAAAAQGAAAATDRDTAAEQRNSAATRTNATAKTEGALATGRATVADQLRADVVAALTAALAAATGVEQKHTASVAQVAGAEGRALTTEEARALALTQTTTVTQAATLANQKLAASLGLVAGANATGAGAAGAAGASAAGAGAAGAGAAGAGATGTGAAAATAKAAAANAGAAGAGAAAATAKAAAANASGAASGAAAAAAAAAAADALDVRRRPPAGFADRARNARQAVNRGVGGAFRRAGATAALTLGPGGVALAGIIAGATALNGVYQAGATAAREYREAQEQLNAALDDNTLATTAQALAESAAQLRGVAGELKLPELTKRDFLGTKFTPGVLNPFSSQTRAIYNDLGTQLFSDDPQERKGRDVRAQETEQLALSAERRQRQIDRFTDKAAQSGSAAVFGADPNNLDNLREGLEKLTATGKRESSIDDALQERLQPTDGGKNQILPFGGVALGSEIASALPDLVSKSLVSTFETTGVPDGGTKGEERSFLRNVILGYKPQETIDFTAQSAAAQTLTQDFAQLASPEERGLLQEDAQNLIATFLRENGLEQGGQATDGQLDDLTGQVVDLVNAIPNLSAEQQEANKGTLQELVRALFSDKTDLSKIEITQEVANFQQERAVANSAAFEQQTLLTNGGDKVAAAEARVQRLKDSVPDGKKRTERLTDELSASERNVQLQTLTVADAQSEFIKSLLSVDDVRGRGRYDQAAIGREIDRAEASNDPEAVKLGLARRNDLTQEQARTEVGRVNTIRTSTVDPRDVVAAASVSLDNATDDLNSVEQFGSDGELTAAYAEKLTAYNQAARARVEATTAEANALAIALVPIGDEVGQALAEQTAQLALAADALEGSSAKAAAERGAGEAALRAEQARIKIAASQRRAGQDSRDTLVEADETILGLREQQASLPEADVGGRADLDRQIADALLSRAKAGASFNAAKRGASIDSTSPLFQARGALVDATEALDLELPGSEGFYLAKATLRQRQVDVARAEAGFNAAKRSSTVDSTSALAQARDALLNAQDDLGLATPGSDTYFTALGALRQRQVDVARAEASYNSTKRGASIDPASALSVARGALVDATALLDLATPESEDYYAALTTLRQRQLDLAQAERDAASAQRRLGTDLTNPVQQAAEDLRIARDKLAADQARGAPQDVINQSTLDVRASENAAESAAFSQRFSDAQTADQLGRSSHAAYLSYLSGEHDRLTQRLSVLKETDNGYRQAQDQLDQIDQALKATTESLQGQFNLGDIKIPTPFEVRRQLAVDAAPGAVGASNAVTYQNISINGADLVQVKQLLTTLLGPAATSRTAVAAGRKL